MLKYFSFSFPFGSNFKTSSIHRPSTARGRSRPLNTTAFFFSSLSIIIPRSMKVEHYLKIEKRITRNRIQTEYSFNHKTKDDCREQKKMEEQAFLSARHHDVLLDFLQDADRTLLSQAFIIHNDKEPLSPRSQYCGSPTNRCLTLGGIESRNQKVFKTRIRLV